MVVYNGVPVYITTLVVIAMAFGILTGVSKGYKRSIVKMLSTLAAAVLAFIVAMFVAKSFAGEAFLEKFMTSMELQGIYTEISDVSDSIVEIIQSIPAAIITPVLFLVLFVLFKILLWIPCSIVSKLLNIGKGCSVKDRLIGIPVGAVQGIISIMIFVLVFGGYFNLVDKVFSVTDDIDDNEVVSEIRDEMEDFTLWTSIKYDPVIKFACSGEPNNFLFEALSKFEFQGEKYSLTEEAVSISEAFKALDEMANDQDDRVTEDEIMDLERFTDKFGNSVILKVVGSEIVSGGCEKWSNQETFLGIGFSQTDKNIYPLLKSVLDVMSTTTVKTIEDDMHVFIDILKVLNRHEVLNNSENYSEKLLKLLDKGFSSDLINVLSEKKRFEPVAEAVQNMSVNILSFVFNDNYISDAQYDKVAKDIAEALNASKDIGDPEEEQRWLAEEIYTIINDAGINMDKNSADLNTEAIINAFSQYMGEISREDVQKYFDSYYIEK